MNGLSIGEVAAQSGVSRQAIRHYEREGLMPTPRRTAANYRCYSPVAVQRLSFIAHARQWGFKLQEIRDLLLLQDANGDRAEARRIASEKLIRIRQQIDMLQRMESILAQTHDQCPGEGPMDRGCPIIEAIGQESVLERHWFNSLKRRTL